MSDKPEALRFFLVAYSWAHGNVSGTGNLWFAKEGFPSNAWLKQQAQKDAADATFVITNIIEMSAEDFASFCGDDAAIDAAMEQTK